VRTALISVCSHPWATAGGTTQQNQAPTERVGARRESRESGVGATGYRRRRRSFPSCHPKRTRRPYRGAACRRGRSPARYRAGGHRCVLQSGSCCVLHSSRHPTFGSAANCNRSVAIDERCQRSMMGGTAGRTLAPELGVRVFCWRAPEITYRDRRGHRADAEDTEQTQRTQSRRRGHRADAEDTEQTQRVRETD
jgi:hypothetical protein